MRRNVYKIRFSIAVVLMLLVLGAGRTAFAWKEQQHKGQLTPMALDVLELLNVEAYPREIWKTYRAFIEQGAWDEDFPCGLSGVRANNHYFHPLSGRGLSDAPWIGLGDPDVGTPDWALENPRFSLAEEFGGGDQWAFKGWGWTAVDVDLGDMSWKRAIQRYGYSEDSKRLAYYTLGFLCHLLQDMGDPEHVHDDPHGASGYTGFELWVWQNWESLKPPSPGALKPRTFGTVEEFFRNLSLLGYSIDRFQGGELAKQSGVVNATSDLGKMFRIRWLKKNEWILKNYGEQSILGWTSSAGGTNVANWDFEWNLDDYRESPLWTKGHDQGEWWPTSMEIPGSSLNDEEGYYYIELSGDFPGEPWANAADPGRNLYPAAFLPTPLPEVADQCVTWRTDSSEGLHLYSLIGRRIFPAVVEHTAGLIEHFFDIVNHPPFVKSVRVSQTGGGEYSVYWKDVKESPSVSMTITDVGERLLTADSGDPSAETAQFPPFEPGRAAVLVVFSEPVRSVAVTVGGKTVAGGLNQDETVWTGEFLIEEDGPLEERLLVSIDASDQNNHCGNTGARLDGNPATPARRVENYPEYDWVYYEPGEDTHYSIPIKREEKTPIQASGIQPSGIQPEGPGTEWAESESYTNTIGGTWTLNPETGVFRARWKNGAQATLQLEKFSEDEVIVTRHDASGASAGLSARYVGKRSGRRASGTVTWQWQGRTWSGTWEASW